MDLFIFTKLLKTYFLWVVLRDIEFHDVWMKNCMAVISMKQKMKIINPLVPSVLNIGRLTKILISI